MDISLTPPRRRSFSARIRTAFLSLGLLAIGLTGVEAFRIADAALEAATYERLTGIRETKKRQIESYFRDVLRIAGALASDESSVDALLGFQAAWLDLQTAARSGTGSQAGREDLEASTANGCYPR